MGKEF